jgi:hypothetical protein
MVKEGAGRFRKRARGGGGRIRQRDQVDRPDSTADFIVVDYIVKLAIIRQRV